MHKKRISLFKPAIIFLLLILAIFSVVALAAPKKHGFTAGACSATAVSANTFIKTNHLLDLTDGFGVSTTKDGGYLLMGDTIPAAGMGIPKPFVVKTDAKGIPAWSNLYASQSMALGSLGTSHFGRLTIETTDGNIITAVDIIDFVDENTKELYGDILVTKLSSKGKQIWSILLGDYSIDRPRKIWTLPDGGVLLLARFMKTGYGSEVADTDTIPKFSVLIKVDKNGKVQSSKKLDWDALDMERLADGSFIALAKIAIAKTEQPKNIVGPEVVMGDLPTMIKLDSNLNISWAKSLEMVPAEINTISSITGNTFTMGKTVIRLAGGDFRNIQPTPDGGFLAFGFDNPLLTQGLYGRLDLSGGALTLRPLAAVKVDANGNYKWTKKLTTTLISGGTANDFHVVKTADNNFVIMEEVVRDSANNDVKTKDAGRKRKTFLDRCEELKGDCVNEQNLTPELQALADAANAAMLVYADSVATNLELIKTDADFNPIWVKQIDVERNLTGFGLTPTMDNGVVISGSLLTTKMHLVMLSMEPYKEAILIKADVNGGISGCAAVTDHSQATLEDQSSYLVMQDMKIGATKDFVLKINKKVPEKIATTKNAVRDICQHKKNSIKLICSTLMPKLSTTTPVGQTSATPTPKTWAVTNYDNATAVTVEGEKNIMINTELLPILNQVFNNQVKIKDSMKSMWLTYIFSRPTTRADVEAVEKKYKELGYKIDESEGGRLFVSRVGLTLHMTFSIQDSMLGKVEVLF